MCPEWLPPKLRLNGTLDDTYELLHRYYKGHIENQKIIIEGVPVIYDSGPDAERPQYSRGFTHLVTRKIDGSKLRIFDQQRAEKISWVAPILQNYKDPSVVCFWFKTPKGALLEESLAVWVEEHDFVLILRWRTLRQAQKVLVTAHNIDNGNRNYWNRKMRRPDSRVLHF